MGGILGSASHPALPLSSPVSPAPKLFSLKLFGGASLEGPAGPVTGRAAQRHRLALLALVAASGSNGVTRDKLTALLWPEADADRGRHLLSNSLYMLRQALGEDALVGAGDVVRLDFTRVRCDVRDFEDAIGRTELARAVGLYTGCFLDGFFLTDAPEFERWAARERERLATAYARALESLAEHAEKERDYRGAAEWWKVRAAHDLLDSRVALRLMQALEAAGNRAGALQHASVHQRLLQEELGLQLTPEITALAERLRRERTPEPLVAEPVAKPVVQPVAQPVADVIPEAVLPPEPPRAPAGVARARARRRGWWRAAAAVVVAVCVLGAAWSAWAMRSRADRPARSIVVLPFVNMTSDAENEYFSDGITEEIIAQLAAVPSLKVISRTSAMHYKGRGAPLRQIAAELGVAHVLEGSVRREGDRVRITAQLIDASTDEHLWSQRYDRRLVDVFAVQEDIAREVGRALAVTLGSGGRTAAARGTRIPEAYELYLRGRYHWQKRTKEGHEQALAYFRRAIEQDSTYADAYAGLASVYLTGYAQYIPGFADREAETYAGLKWSAERAVALDDNSALAHRALAVLLLWQRDWPGAERELLRTLELNPGDEQAHNWYGALLGMSGRIDDAVREARRAYEMDPFNLVHNTNYADQLILARDYDRAIAIDRNALEIDPNHPFARRALGILYALKGMYPEAERELRRVADAAPNVPDFRADLAYAIARGGRREEARRILREVESLPDGQRKRDAAFSIGRAHVALGEPDSAFAWFDRADWRWPHRGNRFDPALDPVRTDPRFARLSERVDREMGVR